MSLPKCMLLNTFQVTNNLNMFTALISIDFYAGLVKILFPVYE